MTTQRQRLEAERDELMSMLNNSYTPQSARAQLAKELRRVIDEIAQLDNGTHWTQYPGETLQKIVASELSQKRRI